MKDDSAWSLYKWVPLLDSLEPSHRGFVCFKFYYGILEYQSKLRAKWGRHPFKIRIEKHSSSQIASASASPDKFKPSLESRPIRVIAGFNFQNTRGNTATTRSTSTTSASRTSGRPTTAATPASSTGHPTPRGTRSGRAGEAARTAPTSSTTPATASTGCGSPWSAPRRTCSPSVRRTRRQSS